MSDRKTTLSTECSCGCQTFEYIWIQSESGAEYQAWICVRCGKQEEIR